MKQISMFGAALVAALTASCAQGAEKMVRWEDPKEGAFSLFIPKDWKATGGITRQGARPVGTIECTSRDGQVYFKITDDFPLFRELLPRDIIEGRREGDVATDEWGAKWRVLTHAPGKEFLTKYFLPDRGRVKIVSESAVKSLTMAQLEDIRWSQGAGEVEYRIRRVSDGKEVCGAAFCVTHCLKTDALTGWNVFRLYLCEAPTERFEETKTALLRATLSLQHDAKWLKKEMERQGVLTNIVQKTQEDINAMFTATIRSWNESRSRVFKRTSDVIRSQVDVFDAERGEVHYGVSDRFNYYWIHRDGSTILGTNIFQRPNSDYRPLQVLP